MTTLDTPSLVKIERQGVSFYTDETLFNRTNVRIAFSCRTGGVSTGALQSLNVGSNVSDDILSVCENRYRLLKALDAPRSACVAPISQVHGDGVFVVENECDNHNKIAWCSSLETLPNSNGNADAIVVSAHASNTVALLSFADCMPIILVAPDGSFAVVHAGWRGVYSRIVAKSLRILLQVCSQNFCASDINVYIGPYIHKECFEVSPDLANDFAAEFGDFSIYNSTHVDLGACIKETLINEGVHPDKIADLNKCTVCNQDEFYSHRSSGGQCGRHAAVAFRC